MLENAEREPVAENAVGRTALKYTVPNGQTPVRYKGFAPGAKQDVAAEYLIQNVPIRNGRDAEETFSLDRHGFELRHSPVRTDDLYDNTRVTGAYYPEVEVLVREATGASRVRVFDHTIRSNAPGRKGTTGVRGPARRVHNDYTLKSGPQRVRDLFPADEAERLLRRRFAIVNVWRPIRGPLQEAPLALCDASSIIESDFHVSQLIYPSRAGETYGVAFSPRHRWFYFPDMSRDEALLFKCYDSDPVRARFTPHSAADDPRGLAQPQPRESIEVRTLAFFDM